ncbi:3644_t:CDS:2, partial [Acaulospora morrowiae]
YVKLTQEDFEDDEFYSLDGAWPYEHNIDLVTAKPYKKRALSESRQYYKKIQNPRSRMENAPIDNEQQNARSSDDITEDIVDVPRNTWSQIFPKKLKSKGTVKGNDKELELYKSVFEPIQNLQDWQPSVPPLTANHEPPLTPELYLAILDSVKGAIAAGTQPIRISQGSSGSYFCRNKEERIVGVFKPKNEEPYGHLNPKWTKWIHRNLFPCFFGRSCLIPNLGYISEAAASLLDRRLNLNIVPLTEVVWLSSPSFHYDYLDRRAARSKKNPKPLPEKIGSFQVFLEGFKDANVFLREHPWPEHNNNNDNERVTDSNVTTSERSNSRLSPLMCGRSGTIDDEDLNESYPLGKRFSWTAELQHQFREQFEKLVILDYLMRNTDRGFSNWMIKYCEKDERQCFTNTPPKAKVMKTPDALSTEVSSTDQQVLQSSENIASPSSSESKSSLNIDPKEMAHSTSVPENSGNSIHTEPSSSIPYPHIHVAAIDNGLAFPFKHPDQWRSYPYGWSYLSEALIGQPFTANTRNHFLPLLTDPKWWKETVSELGRFFSIDDDFDEGMFTKQMAVLKGQGWNIVETLSQPNQGPLDLCARQNAMVWDEIDTIEIPGDSDLSESENSSAIDIANRGRVGSKRINSSMEISNPDSNQATSRRSLSEDGSIRRSSLSTSAPAASSIAASGSSKQKWSDRLNRVKEKFNLDGRKDKNFMEGKRTKKVIVERLEILNGSTPFFTWC